MATHGGKRKGAGKPKGTLSSKTLEKQKVQEAFNQRVLAHANDLFNAQFRLAIGSQKVFRVDEEEDDKGKVRRVHTLVTDPEEIKTLLDRHDGSDGTVDDAYYYFQEVLPDNRALDSLLNRTLGKPKDSVDVNHTGSVEKTVVFRRAKAKE